MTSAPTTPTRLDVVHIDEFPRLSAQQRLNLAQLSDFLRTQAPPEQFRMQNFRQDNGTPDESYTCGTIACAVGWGPAAGIAPLKLETWRKYATRCFGASQFVVEVGSGRLWNFLFSCDWRSADVNTPEQAARRIAYFLEHGIPTEFSYDQIF